MGAKRKAAKKPATEGEAPSRLARGRDRKGATFPVPPSHVALPGEYASTLNDLKKRIRTERLRVVLSANAAMTLLYWDIGQVILQRQEREGWGAKVIDRLSADLREAFPDMQGLSARNLLFMRAFAAAYPHPEIVKQLVSQLPWGHIVHLLQRVKDADARLWYAKAIIANGWSRNIMDLQIASQAHVRQGKAVHNFAVALPPVDSDMAAQVFKDPYLFDFIGTADPRREREVEQALVDHVQTFLLELGAGFAFVGRQVHLEFSSADYYLDLSIPTEAAPAKRSDASECREPRARYGAEHVRIVPAPFDAADGADTPFGRRWGGCVTQLTPEHLAALTEGKTLALDVRNEYVQFLKADSSPRKRFRAEKGRGMAGD